MCTTPYMYKAQCSEEQCWRMVGGDADLGSITQFWEHFTSLCLSVGKVYNLWKQLPHTFTEILSKVILISHTDSAGNIKGGKKYVPTKKSFKQPSLANSTPKQLFKCLHLGRTQITQKMILAFLCMKKKFDFSSLQRWNSLCTPPRTMVYHNHLLDHPYVIL